MEQSGLLVDLVKDVRVSKAVGATDKWLTADYRKGVGWLALFWSFYDLPAAMGRHLESMSLDSPLGI